MKKYVDFNLVYPIGSVYISSNNSNPSSLFGGTWTLINKSFTSATGNGTTNLFTPTSNLKSATIYYSRNGQVLQLRVGMTTNVEIKDSTLALGTLNLSALGVSSLPIGATVYVGASDGGNAVVVSTMDTSGNINAVDVVGKSDGILEAGSTVYIYYTFAIPYNLMIDSFCNEFHWKRVS